MNTPRINGLRSIELAVHDLKQSSDFYRKVWALEDVSGEGDTLHMRPTALHDARLRAFRRWGTCAWCFGQPAAIVFAGGFTRIAERPYVLGGLNYVVGWALAGLRGAPRVDADVRAFVRGE